MEEVVKKYVDECLGFVKEHREYLQTVVTQYFVNNKSEIWS